MRNGAEQILEAMSGIRPAYIDAAAAPDSSRQAQRRFRHWRLAAACLAALAVTAAVPVVYEAVRRQPESGTVQSEPPYSEPPYYVQAMQEYMTAVNGRPCDYDFTGMGRDLDIEFDCNDITNGNHHIRIRAAAGDALRLFLFVEITADSEPELGNELLKDGLSVQSRLPDGRQLYESTDVRLLSEEETDGIKHKRYCLICTPKYGMDYADAEITLLTYFYYECESKIPANAESEPIRIDFAAKPLYLPAEGSIPVRRDSSGEGGEYQFGCAAVSPFGMLLLRFSPEEFDTDAWLAACDLNAPQCSGTGIFAPKNSSTEEKCPVLIPLELLAADRGGNIREIALNDKPYYSFRMNGQSWADTQYYTLLEFQEPLDLADTAYLTLNGCRFVNAN